LQTSPNGNIVPIAVHDSAFFFSKRREFVLNLSSVFKEKMQSQLRPNHEFQQFQNIILQNLKQKRPPPLFELNSIELSPGSNGP